MEVSHQFKTTSHTVSSPNATHTACLHGSRLQIRCLATLEIIRSIALPSSHDVRNSHIRWSNPSTPPLTSTPQRSRRKHVQPSDRILVADDENVRVYDLRDERWSAHINNGSNGMGKIIHAEFAYTENEVMVWTDFGSKVTIWSLVTGRTIEIKDPKFSGKDSRGWRYRPVMDAAILAVLCRTAGVDVLMLVETRRGKIIKRVELGTTDAQGLKWSAEGKWIVVWDAKGMGCRVCVYTADGHLYRTYMGGGERVDGVEGLGVKSVEWAPGGQFLAVGCWDRRVTLLGTRTFTPLIHLDHTPTIHIPNSPIYTETVTASSDRSYSLASQPITPPTAQATYKDTAPKQGISIVAFNSDSTIVATRDDSTPTTVWIWDLRQLIPKTVILQHSPVKSLLWHPTKPNLLLMQCVHDEATLYIWNSETPEDSYPNPPEILTLKEKIEKPAGTAMAKWDAKWLSAFSDEKPSLIFGHQQGYVIVWPEGREQILRFEHESDGEESEDSLYDILTGRTPVPPLHKQFKEDEPMDEAVEDSRIQQEYGDGSSSFISHVPSTRKIFPAEGDESSGAGFEDTFREKRKGRGENRREEFYESGMSEMF